MSSQTHDPDVRTVLGLYGTGGFAREVMPFAIDFMSRMSGEGTDQQRVYFVEPHPTEQDINGIQVISESEFFRLRCRKRYFNIAIADSKVRERFAAQCILLGATPLTIQAANATVYDNNEIGDGAIMCGNTMVTSNAKIGRFFQSNIYSYVAHDCVIGDFVTFAPRVHCNGNVHIRDHAYIGTCAVMKQGSREKPLVIGEGAIVGMGAVVTKDVAPYTTVVGNPAKPHVKS